MESQARWHQPAAGGGLAVPLGVGRSRREQVAGVPELGKKADNAICKRKERGCSFEGNWLAENSLPFRARRQVSGPTPTHQSFSDSLDSIWVLTIRFLFWVGEISSKVIRVRIVVSLFQRFHHQTHIQVKWGLPVLIATDNGPPNLKHVVQSDESSPTSLIFTSVALVLFPTRLQVASPLSESAVLTCLQFLLSC